MGAVALFRGAQGPAAVRGGLALYLQHQLGLGNGATQRGDQKHVLATPGSGKEGVGEEDGGVATGDGGQGSGGHAVGEANLGSGGEIAVIPGGAEAYGVVAVAQHPHEDSDRLSKGDGSVRFKIARAVPTDEGGFGTLPGRDLGGHMDVATGPVGRGDVTEDGAVHLGRGLAAVPHQLHSHLGKLRPGSKSPGAGRRCRRCR